MILLPRQVLPALVCMALLASCSTSPDEALPPDAPDASAEQPSAASSPPATPAVSLTERALLEMTFEEAQVLSPQTQTAQVGTLFRVAADTVEILKTDRAGSPVKVRAKGHVFLEMTLGNRATALCDEAILTIRDALLKGNPMVKQGVNVAKSTSEKTTIFINYDRLQAFGRYEIVKLEDMPLF